MGQLTGQRADFLLFDDLIKSQTDAYSEVIRERTWANFSSAAETRLLPDGKIVGIQTRWHLDDPIGQLVRWAEENRHARQFIYVSLAAWNGGQDSFVLDTRTRERKCLPPYRALASLPGQPYSFSREKLLGKQADLGSSRFSALYMQQPQALEDQMFPEKVWGSVDGVNTDDLLLVVSAWDCANKAGEKNDFTANVVVGRLGSGGFLVLDVWKSKLNFAQLHDVVLKRYGLLQERYKTLPLLVVEDAASGTQLIDTIRSTRRSNRSCSRNGSTRTIPSSAMTFETCHRRMIAARDEPPVTKVLCPYRQTSMHGITVQAASACYAISEARGRKISLEQKLRK